MAKRLHMTTADYVAIAISPALVMALVGSLVFFLIEVLYVGQYQARLNYAFALFVFAAVLIARISIEMGSERAALFALALGVVMFLFLMRFVEHPSAFSHVINLTLLTVVWWCAHQLTWDSTVIDDDQDASGEGLMQRIGVEGPEAADSPGAQGNELIESDGAGEARASWWRWLAPAQSGPHAPGLWVLYFSLAALPLFGIGQHWIPAADLGRRRYAFFLLLVYVSAALALLVTTSFLGLRRYLRQRRVEMPVPIAATWVGVGAALIAVVMLLATLIPRPAAEIALSRVPWQAGSPGGMTASRTSVNRDGGEQQSDEENVQSGETTAKEGQDGDQQADAAGKQSERPAGEDGGSGDASGESGKSESHSADGEKSGEQGVEGSDQSGGESSDASQRGRDDSGESSDDNKSGKSGEASESGAPGEQKAGEGGEAKSDAAEEGKQEVAKPAEEQSDGSRTPAPPESPQPLDTLQNVTSPLGGLAGLLKILFYIIAALVVAYFAWKYRHQLLQALADIWRQLRELFIGTRADDAAAEAAASQPRPRTFAEFRDPFATGQHGQVPPEELVRYTFAAFEAWANDRGRPRLPDCTPNEFVDAAVDTADPMIAEARRLVRLYSELAYASRRIPREAANELRSLWQLMRSVPPPAAVTPIHADGERSRL